MGFRGLGFRGLGFGLIGFRGLGLGQIKMYLLKTFNRHEGLKLGFVFYCSCRTHRKSTEAGGQQWQSKVGVSSKH